MTQTVVQLGTGRGGLPAGTRLSDIYELESTIAAGGMGEVYKGRMIEVGSSRVDLQACKLEYSIVSPK